MWNKDKSATASIAICFAFALLLTVGLALGPWAARTWFVFYRGMSENSTTLQQLLTVFNVCFYVCTPWAYIALYCLLKLLFNIKTGETFVIQNVKYLRNISWCCVAVAIVTFAGGAFYTPFCFVAIAAAFVGLLLRVVKNIMHSAVEIKTENELTI